MRALDFVYQQLGATGFAIASPHIACRLRPDLWNGDGVAARADFGNRQARVAMDGLPGVARYLCRLDGITGEHLVLTKNPDLLARRIEWVTGFVVQDLWADATSPTAPKRDAALDGRTTKQPEADPRGDQFPDVVTREPRVTCGECGQLSAVQICKARATSGLERPAVRVERLCPGFVPVWGSASGDRKAAQRWPELMAHLASAQSGAA